MAMKPKDITLALIAEIFQGQMDVDECLFKKEVCPNMGNCALRHKIIRIKDKVKKELASVTVAGLIGR